LLAFLHLFIALAGLVDAIGIGDDFAAGFRIAQKVDRLAIQNLIPAGNAAKSDETGQAAHGASAAAEAEHKYEISRLIVANEEIVCVLDIAADAVAGGLADEITELRPDAGIVECQLPGRSAVSIVLSPVEQHDDVGGKFIARAVIAGAVGKNDKVLGLGNAPLGRPKLYYTTGCRRRGSERIGATPTKV